MNNFRTECVAFMNFCKAHCLQLFPPVYINIARYLTVMADRVSAFGTIANKLSAICKFYALTGFHVDSHNPTIELLVKSCRRDLSVSSRPKAPLEPAHLILIRDMLDYNVLTHRLFFIALIIQFFGCLRKSNLLPPSARTFSPFKHLTRGDIHFVDGAIVLTLPWTKTLQHKNDIITIPIADVPGAVINPVQLYKEFVQNFPLPPRMPAFAIAIPQKLIVLNQQEYVDILKFYLHKIGLPADAYSSHSVRRGSATTMMQSGCSQQMIKRHGTWKSSCYERYITVNHNDKLQPTQKMVSYINSIYGDSH